MIALGLGSSDRNALGWLRRTLAALKNFPELQVVKVSPVYESQALLPAGAPASWNVPYLNLVVACEATHAPLSPPELLGKLKQLEKKLGRLERGRWAPREIDIDLLAWTGVRLDSENLSIPHPGLLERPFALLPLAMAAPELLAACDPRARAQALRWNAPGAHVPYATRKSLERLTELVAILNLTPDSFSDGGNLPDEESILRAAQTAVRAGAQVLDLGAESTRPGAAPIDAQEEWDRLAPALRVLAPLRASTPGLKLSIDSRRPETFERALESGAVDWLNDVTGFESPRMRALARTSGADIVVMHSLSIPPSRELTLPLNRDPMEALLTWGREKLESLVHEKIEPGRVILDPGLGFGKSPEQNFRLLQQARKLHGWGTRILIGHSRKSFLAPLFSGPSEAAPKAEARDLETAMLSAELADQGIEYLRVHDVASQARALRLSAAWDGSARFRGMEPC